MRGRLPYAMGSVIAAALAVAVAACAQGSVPNSVSPSSGSLASRPNANGPNNHSPDHEFTEVCKDYVGGSGPDVTFTVQVDIASNNTIDDTFQITLAAGTCQDVWVNGTQLVDAVTVTENVPAGYTSSWALSTRTAGVLQQFASNSGNVATGGGSKSQLGALYVFTNTPTVPPPPPGGLAGC